MRPLLARWVSDADAIRHLDRLGVEEIPLALAYQRVRQDDLYLSLAGELFDQMRDGNYQPRHWAQLGNALAQYAVIDRRQYLNSLGISLTDTALFAAAAFYFGGFPASAYLTMKAVEGLADDETSKACYDLLARPAQLTSSKIGDLVAALRSGDMEALKAVEIQAAYAANSALQIGPDQWIPARLLEKLLVKFNATNIRAILPDGTSDFWTPLVSSLIQRATWDFFPSQIEAIQRGLLQRSDTFSLQMPTGAGKTALCETLLYWHLSRTVNDVAVMVVPYRSLASELRSTLVRRLNKMGISARCSYGGTVPSADEMSDFDSTRALVATPETLSGILSANPLFSKRISLVICDEGHLLDASSRGVGLELLLARMKAREEGSPRFVFVSAIVPNIEEINAWLGGAADSVVRSDYRPALAEFAVLRARGQGAPVPFDLIMHPHENAPIRYKIESFLSPGNFQYANVITGRTNRYNFKSIKVRAIATARKALSMGAVVVFAANKRGKQGAIGLAHELLNQLGHPLQLPKPIEHSNHQIVEITAEYLEIEYGTTWIGSRALRAGAVLHHGSIPQETREVVEAVLRHGHVKFGICTSTLAEGVNLPIRTLVLYSVRRAGKGREVVDLLTRDIKNLAGRAGRPDATTRGLVICANEKQWPLIAPVARNEPGERVKGALRLLIERLKNTLALRNVTLSNNSLEGTPQLHSLIDGIDATLVDLAATEIGDEELVSLAINLADETFAARQTDAESNEILKKVFSLRASRVAAIRAAGRLEWVRESGARPRLLDVVESTLLPRLPRWDDITDPIAPEVLNAILEWAWNQRDIEVAIRAGFNLADDVEVIVVREAFFNVIRLWLGGSNFVDLAAGANLSIDDMLGLHAHVITFAFQTVVEQAIALLAKLLESMGLMLASAVVQFPEHLRFGVPTAAGRTLASGGIRHRHAFVTLGEAIGQNGFSDNDRNTVFHAAQQLLFENQVGWSSLLGVLVFNNTCHDVEAVTKIGF